MEPSLDTVVKVFLPYHDHVVGPSSWVWLDGLLDPWVTDAMVKGECEGYYIGTPAPGKVLREPDLCELGPVPEGYLCPLDLDIYGSQ